MPYISQYNRLLDASARTELEPLIRILWGVAPDLMTRKIPEANVQQAFTLGATLDLAGPLHGKRVLCAGCYEDSAYETLKAMGYDVVGIDPQVDGFDLAQYVSAHPDAVGTFDVVFATSVLEHVADDLEFTACAALLLKPGGLGVFTMDFRNDWKIGHPMPPTCLRFYTQHDLTSRLLPSMRGCSLLDAPSWSGEPDFSHAGCTYSFASFTVRKSHVQ